MEKILISLKDMFIYKQMTLSIAESITGGLVSKKITDVPGSSAFFKGGIITYSVDSKLKLLNIPRNVIKKNGVVSKEVAALMAANVKKVFDSDVGVGITGVAGPDLCEDKKVGLVFAAIFYKNLCAFEWHLRGKRDEIREEATRLIIKSLLEVIGGKK